MALPKVKSTYSLDVDTVRELERLSERWKVSKSEALRRAIHAAGRPGKATTAPAVAALDRLQRQLALDARKAAAWAGRAKQERLASFGVRRKRSR